MGDENGLLISIQPTPGQISLEDRSYRPQSPSEYLQQPMELPSLPADLLGRLCFGLHTRQQPTRFQVLEQTSGWREKRDSATQ